MNNLFFVVLKWLLSLISGTFLLVCPYKVTEVLLGIVCTVMSEKEDANMLQRFLDRQEMKSSIPNEP